MCVLKTRSLSCPRGVFRFSGGNVARGGERAPCLDGVKRGGALLSRQEWDWLMGRWPRKPPFGRCPLRVRTGLPVAAVWSHHTIASPRRLSYSGLHIISCIRIPGISAIDRIRGERGRSRMGASVAFWFVEGGASTCIPLLCGRASSFSGALLPPLRFQNHAHCLFIGVYQGLEGVSHLAFPRLPACRSGCVFRPAFVSSPPPNSFSVHRRTAVLLQGLPFRPPPSFSPLLSPTM